MLELKDVLSNRLSMKKEKKGFIYFLIDGNEIIYVGQTAASVEARIQAHYYNGKKFDSYSFTECPIDQLNLYEAAYIVKFQPTLNTNLPPNNLFKTVFQIKRDYKIDAWTIRRAIRKLRLKPVFLDYYNLDMLLEGVE